MEEASKLRVRKQTYLRSEVLDKGLSGEDFLEYLKSQKEGGRTA